MLTQQMSFMHRPGIWAGDESVRKAMSKLLEMIEEKILSKVSLEAAEW